jgi:hypothetical protein
MVTHGRARKDKVFEGRRDEGRTGSAGQQRVNREENKTW